jgi:hypothetical protein
MVLKYHISPYPSLHENMVVRIWEAQSDGPSGWVYEEVIPERNGAGVPTVGAGHQVPTTITVNGLDKVVHVVRLYSAVSSALLHQYNVEPQIDLVQAFDPIRFKIDDGGALTPPANSDTYTDPKLVGLTKDQYIIMRNGYGQLLPDIHYTVNPGAGSWTFVAPDIFNTTEEFTITLLPKNVTTLVNDSVVGKWFGGFVDIAANTSYLPSHLRKLLRFVGSVNYTFGALDAIPIGYGFVFNNVGNPVGTPVIHFDNGPLKWGGASMATISLPPYVEACFSWDGVNWNVVYISDASFINGTTIPQGTILGVGEFVLPARGFPVGDLPGGAQLYEVDHNRGIAGDYTVQLSVKSNVAGTYNLNMRQLFTWYHHPTEKANKFMLGGLEFNAVQQNISVSWLLIKL